MLYTLLILNDDSTLNKTSFSKGESVNFYSVKNI